MDLAQRVLISQEPAGHSRVRVRHATTQLAVDKIGEIVVLDAGHA
jgi:hypothetical protein